MGNLTIRETRSPAEKHQVS